MEYSIVETFIKIFEPEKLIDVMAIYDSNHVQLASSNLLKFKDKFLSEMFGSINGIYPRSSINNLFGKNQPKWAVAAGN